MQYFNINVLSGNIRIQKSSTFQRILYVLRRTTQFSQRTPSQYSSAAAYNTCCSFTSILQGSASILGQAVIASHHILISIRSFSIHIGYISIVRWICAENHNQLPQNLIYDMVNILMTTRTSVLFQWSDYGACLHINPTRTNHR